jgi:hypothetical protein
MPVCLGATTLYYPRGLQQRLYIIDSLLVLEGTLHKANQSQSHSYASHLNRDRMTAHELENEPVVPVEVSTPLLVRRLPHKADESRQNELTDDSSEDAVPREKSGVRPDPNFVTVMRTSYHPVVQY